MSWREDAACSGRGDINWHDATPRANLAAARVVCASCPVRGLCLDEALADNLAGIWAGTTVNDRKQMRRTSRSLEHRSDALLAQLEREARDG